MSKMIQLRNVPDELHRRLKVRAAQNGQSLSDYLIAEARMIADKPTSAEILYRLSGRSPVKVKESAAKAVRTERDAR